MLSFSLEKEGFLSSTLSSCKSLSVLRPVGILLVSLSETSPFPLMEEEILNRDVWFEGKRRKGFRDVEIWEFLGNEEERGEEKGRIEKFVAISLCFRISEDAQITDSVRERESALV